MARDQALAVFEPAQFLHRRHRDVRIRADAPARRRRRGSRAAGTGRRRGWLRWSGRSPPSRRCARCPALPPSSRWVACTRVQRASTSALASSHSTGRAPRSARQSCTSPICSAMWMCTGIAGGSAASTARIASAGTARRLCSAQPTRSASSCVLAQRVEQAQVGIDVVAEAALALGQRAAVEAAGHVQHRQQGQADAGFARGGDQRARHRRRVGVRAAVGRVVQVVELADRGVAGFEHLDVQLRGDGLQRVGVEARGEAVHRLAPGPERVLRVGLALGQARHRALERVRMQVGDAGHDPAAPALGCAPVHRDDAAAVVEVEAGVDPPAAGGPEALPRAGSSCRHSRPGGRRPLRIAHRIAA